MVHELPSQVMSNCSDGFLVCFGKWASDVTSGGYWLGALIAFCVVIFLATLRFGSVRAFGFASMVGLFGGVWLAVIGLVAWWVASTLIIIGLIGLGIMILSRNK